MTCSKHWNGHSGPVLDSVKGFDVIECEPCGFKHVVPIPTAEELEDVYRQEYYTAEKPLYLERTREDLDWWNLVYADRYDTFEELLPHDRRRILDVGSGPGFFLLHGKNVGWQTVGIEPSKQAAAHSRNLGLEIIEGFLAAETTDQLGTFDVVHMSEVLEHIPHPTEMLSTIRDLLSPGGLLCVVVPNDYSPFQAALRNVCGYEPWWVAPPHHLNYFSFESLSLLMERCGYEVLLREASFPIDLFLLMGDNYVGDEALGRACHTKRKQFELVLHRAEFSHLKRSLYRGLASQGLGREALMVARKKGKHTDNARS